MAKFDAVINKEVGTGFGAIFREHMGPPSSIDLICYICTVYDPNEAEMLALRRCIDVGRQMCFENLMYETDCQVLFDVRRSRPPHSVNYFVWNLDDYAQQFNMDFVPTHSWVRRCGNAVADKLAFLIDHDVLVSSSTSLY